MSAFDAWGKDITIGHKRWRTRSRARRSKSKSVLNPSCSQLNTRKCRPAWEGQGISESGRVAFQEAQERDALHARTASIEKLKQLMDKAISETTELTNDLAKLGANNYPQEMIAWCSDRINKLVKLVNDAQDMW